MMAMSRNEYITLNEALDDFYGEIGTPERDRHEREVKEAINIYNVGRAIKEARLRQHLTQEELGDRVGVKKSQISRLENGNSMTLPTMSRIFKALGFRTASLELGGEIGSLVLW